MKAFLFRRLCWCLSGHLWMPSGTLILTGRLLEECHFCHAVRARNTPVVLAKP